MHINMAVVAAVLALAAAGCAGTPDVNVAYYLPTTDISVHVVRTVACDAAHNIITSSTVTASVVHSADLSQKHLIALKELDGTFSDTDIQIQLYDDGRLKGVNGSSTGQVEAAIKPLLALGTTLYGDSHSRSGPDSRACAFSTDPSKPTTVTFTRRLDWTNFTHTTNTGRAILSDIQYIDPDPDYVELFKRASSALGYTCVKLERLSHDSGNNLIPYSPGMIGKSDLDNTVEIDLRQPASLGMTVFRADKKDCSTAVNDDTRVWSGQGLVAQLGTPYKLPIPKARLFGKLQFNLVLAESGALNTLQYTKQSGAAIAGTTANEIAGSAEPTTAQQLSEVKSEADLIAQQQRLVRCQANPKSCN